MSYVEAPTLIQYAGDDQPPRAGRGLSPSGMFDLGYDTLQIAEHLGISEAEALKRINKCRSAKRNLPSPYRKGWPE